MMPLPHAHPRAARLRLGEATPAVLRFPNGTCKQGDLRTISVTGGLLRLPQNLDFGLRCKLMFVTRIGPILGVAELLRPVSTTLQPFRFTALDRRDQQRLGAAIQSTLGEKVEEAWINKYRAAIENEPSRGIRLNAGLRAATLVTLGLAGVACVLHFVR